MGWFFLWLALCLGTQVWLCFRVARTSVPLAIATFLLGPIGALYTLFKEHGEEDTSVTTPFIANLACSALLFMAGWQALTKMMQESPAELQAAAEAGQPAPDAPATAGGLTPASLEVASPAAAAAQAAAAQAAAAQRAPQDPLEQLAAELHGAGVQSTVLRMPAGTRLPEGVVSGAQLALTSVPGKGAWMNPPAMVEVAASAGASAAGTLPAAAEVSAIFLRCEAATTCRGVARAYMLQDAATRPRVLQNGPMLLLISTSNAAQAGHLHSVVASAFRHLPQP